MLRALLSLALLVSCGSDDGPAPPDNELFVAVTSARPADGNGRVVLASIYLDPFALADGPARVAVDGRPLVRRNPINGQTVWVAPGPRTTCFDLPEGVHTFALLDAHGTTLATSDPVGLAGGAATQVVFHGGPQHIMVFGLPPAALGDIPEGMDVVRVMNFTALPASVMRCSGTTCSDTGRVLARYESYEEMLPLDDGLSLEIRPEDGPAFVPITAFAKYGGHLVAGLGLLAAPAPRGCYYLCDPGIVRTSFVADSALDPQR